MQSTAERSDVATGFASYSGTVGNPLPTNPLNQAHRRARIPDRLALT
ncbi:hypothetical protein [Methylocaldum marinum]|nr:hypothetical protein [Methylocaldum marinum]